MPEFILKLYDYMKMHRMTCFFSFVVITLLLVMSVCVWVIRKTLLTFCQLIASITMR